MFRFSKKTGALTSYQSLRVKGSTARFFWPRPFPSFLFLPTAVGEGGRDAYVCVRAARVRIQGPRLAGWLASDIDDGGKLVELDRYVTSRLLGSLRDEVAKKRLDAPGIAVGWSE